MQYCIHCGVKLSRRYNDCPLCGLELEFQDSERTLPPLYPEELHKITRIPNSGNPKDMVTLRVVGFTTLLIVMLTTAIDLYINREPTWSMLSTLSIIYLNIVISAILQLRFNPGLLYLRINIMTIIFLFLLDFITPGYSWFTPFVLPILVALQIISIVLSIIIRAIEGRLIKSSVIMLGLTLFLIIIEGIIRSQLSWSLIPASIIIPSSLFLIRLNYILYKSR